MNPTHALRLPATPAARPSADVRLVGALFVLAAVSCFSGLDTTTKMISAVPVMMLVWFRYVTQACVTAGSWEPILPGHVDGAVIAAEVDVEVAVAIDTADETVEVTLVETVVVVEREVPALHQWSGATTAATRPGRDAYALRLVSSRVLYDGGVTAAATPSFGALIGPAELRVNPQDRDRIGVDDGVAVRVTSARGQLDVPVRADATVPLGTALLTWNLPGASVGTLVDATSAVTDLRVESIR